MAIEQDRSVSYTEQFLTTIRKTISEELGTRPKNKPAQMIAEVMYKHPQCNFNPTLLYALHGEKRSFAEMKHKLGLSQYQTRILLANNILEKRPQGNRTIEDFVDIEKRPLGTKTYGAMIRACRDGKKPKEIVTELGITNLQQVFDTVSRLSKRLPEYSHLREEWDKARLEKGNYVRNPKRAS